VSYKHEEIIKLSRGIIGVNNSSNNILESLIIDKCAVEVIRLVYRYCCNCLNNHYAALEEMKNAQVDSKDQEKAAGFEKKK
jgi:hypothetical protein